MLKYSEFLAENVQRSKAIIAQRMKDYEGLKERLTKDNTLGYLGKLTELLFLGAPIAELTAAYDRLLALRRSNVRVNIDDMKSLEEIQDSLEEKERDVRVRQVLSQVPPAQRQWFTGDSMTKSDLNLLDGMSRVNSAPFMRKVSQYRDKQTMIRMANVFMKSAGSPADRAHFRGLAGKGLKVVHEDDRVIVFHTEKVEDLLKVGGDTAWCIKNPGTFKRYTSDGATQFVLIDFDQDRWDPLFKVGFTLSAGGEVIYAHDILDKSCKPYLTNLLEQRGVDPISLARATRKKPDPLDMTKSDFSATYTWLKQNGVTAEEAPRLIRSLLRRPNISRSILESNPCLNVLHILFSSLSKSRYLTTKDMDELVPPRSITKAARSALFTHLQRSGFVLPDLGKLKIRDLDEPRVFPYLPQVAHDVFEGTNLYKCVDYVIDVLTPENMGAHQGLADEMRRIIGLTDGARRQVLIAAWEKAVNGVTPDYGRISDQVKTAGGDLTQILDLLGVRRPFDEDEVLGNWHRLKKELIVLPPRVTLTMFDHYIIGSVASWLKGKGVEVDVAVDSEKLLAALTDHAVWESSTGRYRSRTTWGRMPAPLGEQAVRDRIVRTKKRRFDWRPDTQFPFTVVVDSVPYTIDKKK
jgi:hypothetical protein